jgi:DNA-binding NarL/FixJ family response regulator
MEPLPVLVVSADPLARAGLGALVGGRADLALAGAVPPGEATLHPAAVLLWDLGRGGDAPTLPAGGAPVVALVEDEAQAGEALRAGARGVLFRGAAADALAAALQAAARGLAVLDPVLAGDFVRAPAAAPAVALTPREGEVLALLAEGLGNKGIGARLGISEHTAKFHVNAILGKLGVESRAEAIVRAARLGLVVL